jgi:hypothetical protein
VVGGVVGCLVGGVVGVVGVVDVSVSVSCGPAAPFSDDTNRATPDGDVTANVYTPAFVTDPVRSNVTAAADAAGFTDTICSPTAGAVRPDNFASVHDVDATFFTDTDAGNTAGTSRVSFNSAFATDAPAGNAFTVNFTKLTIRSPDFVPATNDSLLPNVYDGRDDDEYASSDAATRTGEEGDGVDAADAGATTETAAAAAATAAETETDRNWRV